MPNRRDTVCSSLIALVAALGCASAHAQAGSFHPTKPVTLVVPYSPAGGTDAVARVFAQHLGELWGQPVLVENRVGANGVIGSAVVAKAPADGHTLLLSVASIVINPYVSPAPLPYDTRQDFTPITTLAKPVVVMVSSPQLGATDVRSFVTLARKAPGKFTFASSEPSTRMYGERLKTYASIRIENVPYKGAAQWMTDVMSGTVDVGFASLTSALPFVKDKRLAVLGVLSAERTALLPETPTMSEQGVAGMESQSWYGLFGPGKMPAATVQAIYKDVMLVMARPEVREKIAFIGADLGGDQPTQFAAKFAEALENYGKLVRELGLAAR
jgi:tripartite-type tricarboxylate transporter receptor subunit TctC